MRITRYDGSQKSVWDNFVLNSKNGTFLFARDYMDYHSDRFKDHSLLVWDEKDKLIAVLPAHKIMHTLVSHGGLTYGGFVTDARMKTPLMLEVFEDTVRHLREQSFQELIYKTIPYIYHKIPSDEDRYALFLSNAKFIRRGVLTVIDARNRLPMQERRRRAIEKAKKRNLVIRGSEEWENYWELLTRTLLKNHNTRPVHSLQEICLLHTRFPKSIKLITCHEGDRIIAGVVIYESETVAHTQYIATDERGREVGALDLLFDFLLTQVYAQKRTFDFGTSDENNGLYLNRGLIDQKEGFGARAVVHDHYAINLAECEPGQFTRVME